MIDEDFETPIALKYDSKLFLALSQVVCRAKPTSPAANFPSASLLLHNKLYKLGLEVQLELYDKIRLTNNFTIRQKKK